MSAGTAAQCVCGSIQLQRRPAASKLPARPAAARCQSQKSLEVVQVQRRPAASSVPAAHAVAARPAADRGQGEDAGCSYAEPDASWPRRQPLRVSRRVCGVALGAVALTLRARPAQALLMAPSGSRLHQDRLDGYYFFYPDTWAPVTTSGNDVFYRNPYNVNENLFVDVSSPSSSRYGTVMALGSPEAAAQRTLAQFLEELMSTRLGVRREGEVVTAAARTADDGKQYYDIEVRVRSYASRNQLAADPRERAEQALEWDRRYVTVLGVANQRLYSFRLQTASDTYDEAQDNLLQIAHSFRCKEVVA